VAVLITGIDGYIGQALASKLVRQSQTVYGLTRRQSSVFNDDNTQIPLRYTQDLATETAWDSLLNGIDTVVHLAGRAHVLRETSNDPLAIFRRMNTQVTARLAEAAAGHGVQRFVFISSIKVNGEVTLDAPFRHNDQPVPSDYYAISKWEAEQALHQISSKSSLQITIVRPPLVYGPGVKGNFYRLLRWIDRGWPLPFGACHNRRSLIGLTNLVELLTLCITNPNATGQTFLAADGMDLSTPELIRRIATALGRQERLISVPAKLIEFSANMLGKHGFYDRVCGSLCVDIGHTRDLLGWNARYSVEDELSRVASWFRARK
jgi:nucleoside-diphosphate-sugar epimerase